MSSRVEIDLFSGPDLQSSCLFSGCIGSRKTWLRTSACHCSNHMTNSFPASYFDVMFAFRGPHRVEQVQRSFRTVRTVSFHTRYLQRRKCFRLPRMVGQSEVSASVIKHGHKLRRWPTFLLYSSCDGTGVQDWSGLNRSMFLNSSRVFGPRSFW
jgi:hypothetical protein